MVYKWYILPVGWIICYLGLNPKRFFFFTDFFFPAGNHPSRMLIEGLECMLWKMRSRHYSLWKSGSVSRGITTNRELRRKDGKNSMKVRWKQDMVTWSVVFFHCDVSLVEGIS